MWGTTACAGKLDAERRELLGNRDRPGLQFAQLQAAEGKNCTSLLSWVSREEKRTSRGRVGYHPFRGKRENARRSSQRGGVVAVDD